MLARKQTGASFVSFLDVMCCGFGAVILLVVVLNNKVIEKREHQSEDLRAELQRAIAMETMAQDALSQLSQDVEAVERQRSTLTAQADRFEGQIQDATKRAQAAEARSQAIQSSITTLQSQGAALEQAVALLRAKAAQNWDSGKKPVGFTGDGQRQYLTGLKLGGERTLILLDASASMLDETVVNVVRWKLMSDADRRRAPKWQRSVGALHWLVANLRPGKQFQVYRFNTDAVSLVDGTDGKWLSTNDSPQMGTALIAARAFAPIGGTSLHKVFAAVGRMNPKPDSIILITDGLPTQGRMIDKDRLVSAEERLEFFTDAIRGLPSGVPVNTLLLPMEGDPAAAGAFWNLAIATQGSFITPSRDWP